MRSYSCANGPLIWNDFDKVELNTEWIDTNLPIEDRQTVGRRYRDQGYVFTWPDGRPLHLNIANWFEQHTRAAGLPRIRLHDVCHSYASAAPTVHPDTRPPHCRGFSKGSRAKLNRRHSRTRNP